MRLCVIVYQSFDDYVTVESLDGDNKYDAGDHGLQVLCVSECIYTGGDLITWYCNTGNFLTN